MSLTAKKNPAQLEPRLRVQFLPGVGPKRAALLARLGVERVIDLLYLFPRRYIDIAGVTRIGSLSGPAREAAVLGKVVSSRRLRGRGGRVSGFEALLEDSTGKITCTFFGRAFLAGQMEPGQRWIIFGEVRRYRGRLFLNPAEYERISDEPEGGEGGILDEKGSVIPIYPLTGGLSRKIMRRIITCALPAAGRLEEKLPEDFRARRGLLGRAESVRTLHRPESLALAQQAHRSLAFEELFYLELMLLGRKFHLGSRPRTRLYEKRNHLLRRLARVLPFRLTEAQKRVLRTIDDELTGPHPLNRLVQGDVGSGKTIVALIAALRAVENGYQAALMAPTEVLAEQHYRTLKKLLAPLGIEPALLLGKLSAGAKQAAAEKIAGGEAMIAVGTHALIQERVQFAGLGLVIIDEQHRFGVNQRLTLKEKGESTDCLVLTATPIPRSLALTLYGDLDISVIDELPAGRRPVATHIVPENKRSSMYKFIGERLSRGEQAYVVCPRIEEDEQSELAAAVRFFALYRDEIFPGQRVVLLHGRLSPAEKEEAMRAFESGAARVLVGTTVIEVGIDVAAATVMVIEAAERFGLSQLHQLRGRVGRSDKQSWCLLLPSREAAPENLERLEIIASTTDGFKISEEDLRLRGPGDFFGARQSGLPELKVADLLEDYPVLLQARQAAGEILKTDPRLERPEHQQFRRELILRYRRRVAFLQAG